MYLYKIYNVNKKFKLDNKSNYYALKNVNLVFPSKGLHFIKGKSGSGKSTLLNLISYIDKPSSGEIYYKDKKLSSYSKKELSIYRNYEISMVFQHYNLFDNFTGLENVMLPLKIRSDLNKEIEAKELFKKFNIEYLLNKKISTMSGGEKQRVAILRSLITSPNVILCDEPTGALDSENSVIIMDILKEISKDKLVIVVSHNEEIISKYADRIINISDGIIISDDIKKELDSNIENKQSKKQVKGVKWPMIFSRKNLKENISKNIMSFIASLIGLTSTILLIGFSNGSSSALIEYQKKTLDYKHATIQEKYYEEIEGSPLNLVKVNRPLIDKVNFIKEYVPSASIELNFSSLLPIYPSLYINNELVDPAQFIPVFDISLSINQRKLICQGNAPISNSLDEVVVNKEFIDRYLPNINPIGKEINITHEQAIKFPIISNERSYINDKFIFNKTMKISAVVEEFSFMNVPKIYYSYVSLRDEMIFYKLKEISTYLNTDFSCYDLVNDDDLNNVYNGYSYEIYVQDDNEVDNLFHLIKSLSNSETNLSIESTSYQTSDAYNNLTKTFSLSMYVFIIISLLGVMFIFGIVSYSNFIKKKKESAILTTLGAKTNSILDIFTYESMIIAIFSSFISLIISSPLSIVFNKILIKEFGIKNIIRIPFKSYLGIKFILPIGIICLSLFISIFASALPIKIYKKFSLQDELRDE